MAYNKPLNIAFPLSNEDTKGQFFKMNRISREAIKSRLLLLLTTKETERFFLPEYGTNLIQYVFDPNDETTEQDIQDEIKTKISRFMPYLTINGIEFERTDNRINVRITFSYNRNLFTYEDELVITF